MDRRTFLTRTGGLGAVAVLAGCSSEGGNGSEGGGSSEGSEGGGGSDGGGGSESDGSEGGSTDGDGEAVKIGVLVPFSGDYTWVGENVQPVAEMVAEQINAAGGIGGRDVQIVQGDTEASPDASLSATQRLVEVEGVVAVVGPTSLTYSAVADEFPGNRVPTVSPTAGTTALDDQGGEFVFRTVPSDALGGRAIARAARDEQYNSVRGYDRITLMVGNREVFQSFKRPIRTSFEEFGGTVIEAQDFRTGKPSYQSEVERLVSTDPGLTVLVASPEDSVKIMEAAFQAGYEGNWFVTQDQTNQKFLAQSETQVTDGILGLQEAPFREAEETGRLDQFRQDIQEFAGWEENRLFATNTYDAMNVIGLAMQQTVTDGDELTGEAIASNVRTVANPPEQTVTEFAEGASAIENGADVDYRGLVGPIDFNDVGDIVAPFSIQQATSGEWSEVARIPPDALQ